MSQPPKSVKSLARLPLRLFRGVRTQLSLGPGRNRILTEARQIYKTASSTTVDVQADDLHGLSVAVMFCTGFLGLIYIILQNGIFLDRKEIKWLSGFVHWVNSARGHLVLFICAVILWAGTILTTSLSLWLAFHRGQSVQIHVDGASLNQETIGYVDMRILPFPITPPDFDYS